MRALLSLVGSSAGVMVYTAVVLMMVARTWTAM
jgi:hypothetical protein